MTSRATALIAIASAGLLAGCARSPGRGDAAIRALEAEARPIGRGPRFREPVRGRPVGGCDRRLGARNAAHIELFAENRVVLLAAGIGVRGPVRYTEGRIVAARCYGALVTLDPTGVVLVRPGANLTLAMLFRSWGAPLSSTRMSAFTATRGEHVHAFIDGHPRDGDPGTIVIARHSEIVLELGPQVPPHHGYTFPPTPSP